MHFELNVFVNDNFAAWFKKSSPGERNDQGAWNGQNLNGLDPREILLAEHNPKGDFSLLNFIRSQTELCRVLVRATNFPYLKRYPQLVLKNPVAEKEGVAGYEIALNYNGVAFALMPRAASEIKGRGQISIALRQRIGVSGASLPQTGGATRRTLATDEQRPARTGVADVLTRKPELRVVATPSSPQLRF